MNQRGFTLLEMIIGITLLGFVLMLLYGGLRLATRSWEAGEKTVATTSRQAVVDEFLRRQLVLAYPLRWKMDDGQEIVAFTGETGSLHFAAPISARLGTGGIHLVAIEEERTSDGNALRLRWHLPDPELKAFEFPEEGDQVRLVRDIDALEFAYFGSETKDTEPTWHDTWHSETEFPQLVRLRLKPKEGEPWPDILVELKLGADSACRWDAFLKRCM